MSEGRAEARGLTRGSACRAAALGLLALPLLRRAWRSAGALDYDDAVVAIFGGSRGLGLAIARALAGTRARVVLVARDHVELERALEDLSRRGLVAEAIVCDVHDRLQVSAVVSRIVEGHGRIDVLMNVAGVLQAGPMEHMSVADFEEALATHFWGPFFTTWAVLPHMRRRRAGRIVNVSSIGGRIAVPHMLPYCTSKFALSGFSEGLRSEVAKDGIRVTSVYPGLLRTGSSYNATFKGRHRAEFAWFHLADALPVLSSGVERAACRILRACARGDAELVITPPAKLGVAMRALCPELTASLLASLARLLPRPHPTAGTEAHTGWDSTSFFVPSPITALADRATARNNQIP